MSSAESLPYSLVGGRIEEEREEGKGSLCEFKGLKKNSDRDKDSCGVRKDGKSKGGDEKSVDRPETDDRGRAIIWEKALKPTQKLPSLV